ELVLVGQAGVVQGGLVRLERGVALFGCLIEVGLGGCQRLVRGGDVRLGRGDGGGSALLGRCQAGGGVVQAGLCRVHLGLRGGDLLGRDALGGLGQVGLGLRQVGLRLVHGNLEVGGILPRQHLAGGDVVAHVDVQQGELAAGFK